ncbi:MAG: hypothetical protein COW75_01300, partial [Rhodobacterales bacterium CG18_big_fil_WC_8_21_14_2_50_71_9]
MRRAAQTLIASVIATLAALSLAGAAPGQEAAPADQTAAPADAPADASGAAPEAAAPGEIVCGEPY